MTDVPDPDTFDSRAYWKARSTGWTATTISALPTDDTLNQALIEAARIVPGEIVLDLASGTGDPSISIALALGPTGSVTACDLTPEMLTTARRRADELALGNWHVVAGDMAALPFADERFDAITCRFGLMFPKNRVACAAEALRVLKPGGRAAWLVWGPFEENPTYGMASAGIERYFGEAPPPRLRRHALGAPGALEAILNEAGFDAIEEIPVTQIREVSSGDSYFLRAAQRAFPDRFDSLDPDALRALTESVEAAFAPLRDGETYRIPSVVRIGIGRKPA